MVNARLLMNWVENGGAILKLLRREISDGQSGRK
jgi:hypothetical protein